MKGRERKSYKDEMYSAKQFKRDNWPAWRPALFAPPCDDCLTEKKAALNGSCRCLCRSRRHGCCPLTFMAIVTRPAHAHCHTPIYVSLKNLKTEAIQRDTGWETFKVWEDQWKVDIDKWFRNRNYAARIFRHIYRKISIHWREKIWKLTSKYYVIDVDSSEKKVSEI